MPLLPWQHVYHREQQKIFEQLIVATRCSHRKPPDKLYLFQSEEIDAEFLAYSALVNSNRGQIRPVGFNGECHQPRKFPCAGLCHQQRDSEPGWGSRGNTQKLDDPKNHISLARRWYKTVALASALLDVPGLFSSLLTGKENS